MTGSDMPEKPEKGRLTTRQVADVYDVKPWMISGDTTRADRFWWYVMRRPQRAWRWLKRRLK